MRWLYANSDRFCTRRLHWFKQTLSACKGWNSPIPGYLLSLPAIIQRLSKPIWQLRKARRNTLLKKIDVTKLTRKIYSLPRWGFAYSFPHHTSISVFPQDKADKCYSKASVLVRKCSCQGDLDLLWTELQDTGKDKNQTKITLMPCTLSLSQHCLVWLICTKHIMSTWPAKEKKTWLTQGRSI